MRLRVTPTALKGWFQYQCERKFVYETMDRELHDQIPIHEQAVTSAWVEEGNAYEERVVRELARQFPGAVLLPRPTDNGSLTGAASRHFLERSEPRSRFAHQFLVSSTPALARRLRLPADLEIRNGKADLVRASDDGKAPRFRIIDIKATQVATLFHKAQVALYALMLEEMLAEHGIEGVLDDECEIWHRTPLGGPLWVAEPFQVRPYMRLVEDFFHQRAADLTKYEVSREGRDDTPFHIYFKCEQCKYLAHCQRSIADDLPVERLDLSAIAGMSHQSKRTLHVLGINSVGGLIQQEGALRRQDDWVLRTRGWNLVRRAMALASHRVERLEEHYSLQMPARVDRPIYLLADRDPVDGRLVTLGCLVVNDRGEEQYHVRVIGDDGDEASALVEILGVVLATLVEVDGWNSHHGEADGLQTHIFTYEPGEAVDLRDAIGRHLHRAEIRTGLLDLVRIFPPEQVVPEPDYQGFHHLPASSLRNILTDLYALPVKVSHDLHRVSRALRAAGADVAFYEPAPEFERPFSSRLSIDACRRVSDPTFREQIAEDVRKRLAAAHGIATWLHRENAALSREKRFLRLRKKPFRFRKQFNPLGAGDLDILQAQVLLDSRGAQLQALLELARPGRQRVERLNCFADMTLLDEKEDRWGNLHLPFHVPEASRGAELTSSDMGLILSDGSPDLILNPDNWPGLAASLLPLDQLEPDRIRLKVWSSAASIGLIGPLLKRGGVRWYLDKAFVDRNTMRVVNFMSFLAGGQ